MHLVTFLTVKKATKCSLLIAYFRSTLGRSIATSVSLVIMNTLAVTIAGLCVYYLSDPEPTANYGIFGALLLWMGLFANGVFLITKVSFMFDSVSDVLGKFSR